MTNLEKDRNWPSKIQIVLKQFLQRINVKPLPGNKWKAPAASWCGNPALCQNLPDSCNQAAAIWGQPLNEMQGTKSYKIRVPPAIRIRVNALRGHPLGVASKILGAPFFSSRRASLQIRSKQCKNQFQTRSAFGFEKCLTNNAIYHCDEFFSEWDWTFLLKLPHSRIRQTIAQLTLLDE